MYLHEFQHNKHLIVCYIIIYIHLLIAGLLGVVSLHMGLVHVRE